MTCREKSEKYWRVRETRYGLWKVCEERCRKKENRGPTYVPNVQIGPAAVFIAMVFDTIFQ